MPAIINIILAPIYRGYVPLLQYKFYLSQMDKIAEKTSF